MFGEDLTDYSDDEYYEVEPEIDQFYFDEDPKWPRKPEVYDFRTNESYKGYRKKIKLLMIKKSDEELLEYFNKTINYGSNPVVVGIEVMPGKGYNATIIKQSSHQNDKYQPTFRH